MEKETNINERKSLKEKITDIALISGASLAFIGILTIPNLFSYEGAKWDITKAGLKRERIEEKAKYGYCPPPEENRDEYLTLDGRQVKFMDNCPTADDFIKIQNIGEYILTFPGRELAIRKYDKATSLSNPH